MSQENRQRQRYPLQDPVAYTIMYERQALAQVRAVAARAGLPVAETIRRLLDEALADTLKEVVTP